MNQKKRRYEIVDIYQFLEFWIAIGLLVGLIFLLNVNGDNYKTKIENEEEIKYVNEWSVISKEIKERMNEDWEDEFKPLNISLSVELQEHTWNMCKKYNEDFIFVMSIMKSESDFDTIAKCRNQTDSYYSRGLLQLNERYINEFKELTNNKEFNINNVYDNIEGGIAKIHSLRKEWGKYEISDEEMFLAITNSYNKGFGLYKSEVASRGEFFTRRYDQKVLENKIKLEGGQ